MNDTTAYQSSIGQLIEPEPIGYSFNTPGWYLVFGMLLLIAVVVAIIQYRKYLKNAYRREAVKQIEDIVQTKKDTVIFEINRLLKILAIQLFGRKKVAALHGEEWFGFLSSTMKQKELNQSSNFDEFTKALYNSGYQLSIEKVNELVEFAILWIKKHDVKNV